MPPPIFNEEETLTKIRKHMSQFRRKPGIIYSLGEFCELDCKTNIFGYEVTYMSSVDCFDVIHTGGFCCRNVEISS